MPKNKAKRVTRRQKLKAEVQSTINPDGENDDLENNHSTFKPGTLVKIKNIKSRPELNGQYGVITGEELENGRLPIMNPEQSHDITLKKECLDIIFQCPTKQEYPESGMLIWPKVKKVNTPTIQWLYDETLKSCFINVFENSIRDKILNPWDVPMYEFDWLEKKLKKFNDRLRELLNWKDPSMQCGVVNDGQGISNQFCVFYDKASKMAVNEWIKCRHADIAVQWENEVRGPFIYVQHLHEPYNQRGTDNTNYHKGIFYNCMYYDVSNDHTRKSIKNHLKVADRARKAVTELAKTNVCPPSKRCNHCRRYQSLYLQNEKTINKISKAQSVPKYQAYQDWIECERYQDLCEKHGADFDEFMMAYWKNKMDSVPEAKKLYLKHKGRKTLHQKGFEEIMAEFDRMKKIEDESWGRTDQMKEEYEKDLERKKANN